jgi:hypothetical protein
MVARGSSFERRGERMGAHRALLASLVAFVSFFYLWATKAEVWFITLCHVAFWPWLGAAVSMLLPRAASWARGFVGLAAVYATLSVLASIGQARATSATYSWDQYQAWVDCIEEVIRSSPVLSAQPAIKVWQPHVPDVLVELSRRDPRYDLTRALDFPARMDLALAAGKRMDAILLTRSFNPIASTPDAHLDEHRGELRERDRDIMSRGVDTPFGPWVLEELLGKEASSWQARVCEKGPFWATVLIRGFSSGSR